MIAVGPLVAGAVGVVVATGGGAAGPSPLTGSTGSGALRLFQVIAA